MLPEALETSSLPLFKSVLPRHLEIIYEINRHFLDEIRIQYPDDNERLASMSLIDEAGKKSVRMANLACVGSHAINSVAELHTKLLTTNILHDFYEMSPKKFSNKANGVTPRRWMVLSNPRLSTLITKKIGDSWITDLNKLRQLGAFVDNADFISRWHQVKLENKQERVAFALEHAGVELNPNIEIVPRTFMFGGKAIPGNFMAKERTIQEYCQDIWKVKPVPVLSVE